MAATITEYRAKHEQLALNQIAQEKKHEESLTEKEEYINFLETRLQECQRDDGSLQSKTAEPRHPLVEESVQTMSTVLVRRDTSARLLI